MLVTDLLGPLPTGTIRRYHGDYVPGAVQEIHPADLVIGQYIGEVSGGTVSAPLTPLVSAPVIVPAGQMIQRYTVLGQTPIAASVSKNPGATGNGTAVVTALGPYPLLAMTATALNATTFLLTYSGGGRAGQLLGKATVGTPSRLTQVAGLDGTPYRTGQLLITITAGGTAFAAGDSFAIVPSQASVGPFQACVKTATDGSQTPIAVLADDADASGGQPIIVRAYVAGVFRASALRFDPSWALSDVVAALATSNIICKS
jgi:hypothetical protein